VRYAPAGLRTELPNHVVLVLTQKGAISVVSRADIERSFDQCFTAIASLTPNVG
jgi:hypothetical protein